jgi:hypothetical protein
MDIEIVEKLMGEPREALVQVAGEDAALFPALVRAFPETGSHVGFSLFDPAWITAYGRQILRIIGHARDVDSWSGLETTAVRVAVLAIADDLIKYLGLSRSSTLAVVALVILILRGVSASRNTKA